MTEHMGGAALYIICRCRSVSKGKRMKHKVRSLLTDKREFSVLVFPFVSWYINVFIVYLLIGLS
jgi:hypothetical protein